MFVAYYFSFLLLCTVIVSFCGGFLLRIDLKMYNITAATNLGDRVGDNCRQTVSPVVDVPGRSELCGRVGRQLTERLLNAA